MTKVSYIPKDRYFVCASEYQCFWSPIIPKGVSIPKKSNCLTKNFEFFIGSTSKLFESAYFSFSYGKWSWQYNLISAQNSLLYKTHVVPKSTKGCYMYSDRYFLCASEFLNFWSPNIPKGMSMLKKTGCLTKIFQFFHWYYLRLSQKCLFSTF